jgi:hypothetical protein
VTVGAAGVGNGLTEDSSGAWGTDVTAPGSGAWPMLGVGCGDADCGVEAGGDWARASGQSGSSDSVANRRNCASACSSVPAGSPAATCARADSAK